MRRFHRFSAPILLFLLVTSVGVMLTPLTQTSSVPPSGQGAGFREYVLPRLVALNEAVDTVESMIANRSRNVLGLQARADQIQTLTNQIDDYLAKSSDHEDVNQVIVHYRQGRDLVISAISEAREALRSFDFSGLPALVTTFEEGSDHLDEALALLQSVEQSGSSYTVHQAARMRSSGQHQGGKSQAFAGANHLTFLWE